jgi:DNA modification methylase
MDGFILEGNCLDLMKELVTEGIAVQSVVCDPPYGYAFMQRYWDRKDNIVFQPEVWRLCFDLLAPGGYLIAFGGTRTYHRLVCAIEDAGFEIRDQLDWVYGCLSSDTQVVTKSGTFSYTTIKPGDEILCYDKYTGEYSYEPVEQVYEYNIKDTAYHLYSDFTDQIVSRNHRCIVERSGVEIFRFAEEIQKKEIVPFLENLSDLQRAISDPNEGTSQSKQNVFFRMYAAATGTTTKKIHKTRITTSSKMRNFLCCMWNIFLSKSQACRTCSSSSMQSSLQWYFTRRRMERTRIQRASWLDRRFDRKIERTMARIKKSFLEWGCDIFQTEGQLQRCSVCSMSSRIFGNGAKRWLYHRAQIDSCYRDQTSLNQSGSGSSQESQFSRQQIGEFDAVCHEQRSQTLRGWRGHKTTLVDVEPIYYEGIVWCVKVPTGVFVAVRNGKAFVTGNSGFPKNVDVAKAIDKAAGAEREIVGIRDPRGSYDGRQRTSAAINKNWREAEGREDFRDLSKQVVTVPATQAAQEWQGWGSALKPAHEPIVLARKPLVGTLAENVLAHTTGGLNIDACRVPIDESVDDPRLGGRGTWGTSKMAKTVYEGGYEGIRVTSSTKGRFPANFLHDGSDEVLEVFAGFGDRGGGDKRGDCQGQRPGGFGDVGHDKGEGEPNAKVYADSGSAARFFYQAKANKKERGDSKHPTIKPLALMQYLVRLVTPPNGIVLDPFAGTGTTGEAAQLEGFSYILIEREPEYIKDIEYRLSKYN